MGNIHFAKTNKILTSLYDPPLLRLHNFQVNTLVGLFCIMQGGIFITLQEAMEPRPNGAVIDYESSLQLKAVKIKLSFPQQIVEEHEHVRNAPRGSP